MTIKEYGWECVNYAWIYSIATYASFAISGYLCGHGHPWLGGTFLLPAIFFLLASYSISDVILKIHPELESKDT